MRPPVMGWRTPLLLTSRPVAPPRLSRRQVQRHRRARPASRTPAPSPDEAAPRRAGRPSPRRSKPRGSRGRAGSSSSFLLLRIPLGSGQRIGFLLLLPVRIAFPFGVGALAQTFENALLHPGLAVFRLLLADSFLGGHVGPLGREEPARGGLHHGAKLPEQAGRSGSRRRSFAVDVVAATLDVRFRVGHTAPRLLLAPERERQVARPGGLLLFPQFQETVEPEGEGTHRATAGSRRICAVRARRRLTESV